jgi:hypothetical protein
MKTHALNKPADTASGEPKAKNQASSGAILQAYKTAQLASGEAPVQQKENKTGLPDQLKTGVENLSGHSLDDVKVHYNSPQPAALQAHAYAQGTDIHVAPGQEKHLPHEAWHVVQQKQGRVQPTKQLKGTTNINDDAGLEKEADVMGAKAMQLTESKKTSQLKKNTPSNGKETIQKFDELKTPRSTLNSNGKAAFDLLTNNRAGFKAIEKSGGDENAIQDSKKRVTKVSKKISSKAAPRDQQLQTTIGWLGNLEEEDTGAGYNGGHLIASSLGGSGTWHNMVPQDGPENKWGEWRQYEKENRKAIEDTGDSLYVTVELGYSGDSVLPDSWNSWMTDIKGKDVNWYSALFK